MSAAPNLSDDYTARPPAAWRGPVAPDFRHASALRREARRREARFWWEIVRTAAVGALFFSALIGGGFFALVMFG